MLAGCDHLAVAEDRGRRHFYPIPIVDGPIGFSKTMHFVAWYPISLVQRVFGIGDTTGRKGHNQRYSDARRFKYHVRLEEITRVM